MTALIGETLLFEVARTITTNQSLTYYQYRALSSFIELCTLHDELRIFGVTADTNYRSTYQPLLSLIRNKLGLEVHQHTTEEVKDSFATDSIPLYEETVESIYGEILPFRAEELATKFEKDRYAEDVADFIEHTYQIATLPRDIQSVGQRIYQYSTNNASTSEMHFYFRGHLLSSIATTEHLTYFPDSIRLIADRLEHFTSQDQNRRKQSQPLGNKIYTLLDNVIWQRVNSLPMATSYPYISVLPQAILTMVTDRSDIEDALITMRSQFSPFRAYFRRLDSKMSSSTSSYTDKLSAQEEFEGLAARIILPISEKLSTGSVSKPTIFKTVKNSLGLNDLTGDLHLKGTMSEGASFEYNSTSLTGLAVKLGSSLYQHSKLRNLHEPLMPLLTYIEGAMNFEGLVSKARELLPLRDFDYLVPKKLDRTRFEINTNSTSGGPK